MHAEHNELATAKAQTADVDADSTKVKTLMQFLISSSTQWAPRSPNSEHTSMFWIPLPPLPISQPQ